jgi:L-cystine uptake protein TcyP (sodium:dicarboxylate symporter family)
VPQNSLGWAYRWGSEIFQRTFEFFQILRVIPVVKSTSSLLRWIAVPLVVACVASSVSCVTTYDTYGRPVQTVDPGLAVAGVAAAGLIGYAVANNNDNNHYHRRTYTRTYHHYDYDPCY